MEDKLMLRKKSLALLNLCFVIPILYFATNSQNVYASDMTFAVFALITFADIFLVNIKNDKAAYICVFINRTLCVSFSLVVYFLFGVNKIWYCEILYIVLQYWILSHQMFWLNLETKEEITRFNEICEATICELYTQMNSGEIERLQQLEKLVQDEVAMRVFYCYFKSEEIQILLNEDAEKMAQLIKKEDFESIIKLLECSKTQE